MPTPDAPRLTYLRIQNYRALRDLELRDLTPLTVLVGANGSGKSTVLDALKFLGECADGRLQEAWTSRKQRFGGVKSLGGEGEPVRFEVRMLLLEGELTYHLEVETKDDEVRSLYEKADLVTRVEGRKFPLFLSHPTRQDKANAVQIMRGPDYAFVVPSGKLSLREVNAIVSFLMVDEGNSDYGSAAEIDMFSAVVPPFCTLLTSFRHIHFTDDHTKGTLLGEMPQLTPTGDNLRNVLYYLWHHDRPAFDNLLVELKRCVPRLADVEVKATEDERILLYFRDAPFKERIPDRAASDGTLRLLAYLTLLREPKAAGMLGIEEPEGELHHRLLYDLAEAFDQAAYRTQLFVATHSPEFLNALTPDQVWVLHRGVDGYTRATRTADLPGINDQMEAGALLGYLWRRGEFGVGDPTDSADSVQS